VTLRPIRPEDEPELTAVYARLSPETALPALLQPDASAAPGLGAHILANVDYDRRMALVALGPGGELIGVARYAYAETAREAELAIVIQDRWQGRAWERSSSAI
jgi:acetyltransferase